MTKKIRSVVTIHLSGLEATAPTLLTRALAHATGGTRGSIIDIGLDTPPPPPAPAPS